MDSVSAIKLIRTDTTLDLSQKAEKGTSAYQPQLELYDRYNKFLKTKDREGAEQAKALDKVTDLVPDKLLDEAKTRSAMSVMTAARKAEKEAQLARERELASIRVKQSDVALIMKEFEVEEKAAKRRLRECKGDMVATLKSFL